MQSEHLIAKLNSKSAIVRNSTLKKLKKAEKKDSTLIPKKSENCVNLNVHTTSSFSPYTPQLGAYMAYKSGITLAGVCDFGSVSAISEFEKSCSILNMAYVSGFEMTVSHDVLGDSLVSFYGINAENQKSFTAVLDEFRNACMQKSISLAENLNRKLKKFNIFIDFEKDVMPMVNYKKGGAVTLKHVYKALARKIIEINGIGKPTADFIRDKMCFDIAECDYNLLCDKNDPYYIYDLISALRSSSKIHVSESDYPDVQTVLDIAKQQGVICAYQYDNGPNWISSETETEKTLKEFDEKLDELKQLGFNAVCICAKNLGINTATAFAKRIESKEMLVILNEKTEYPRNRFDIVKLDSVSNFVNRCAYAVLGNAISIISNPDDAMFSNKTIEKCPDFSERLAIFSGIGYRKG